MKKLNLNPITIVIVTTLLIISFFVSSSVYASEIKNFRYTAECRSKGSEYFHRNECTSEWSTHTLPSGFVYNVDSLHKYPTSKNGSDNYCDPEWDNYIEVVPGITMPQTLRIRARAKSPEVDWKGHNLGAGGWSKCVFEGQYTKFR